MRRGSAVPDSGAAAVEFALVSVVLFTILFGIIQYGFYFLQATSVTSLTNQVGRAASLREDCDGWRDQVALQVEEGGTGAAVVSVSIAASGAADGTTRNGDPETVTVVWEPTEVGVVPFPEVEFTESTVVRYERLGPTPEQECTWTRPAT